MRSPAAASARTPRTIRELRRELRTLVLMALLAAFGLGIGAFLVVHERIQWPGWLPLLGQRYFTLNAQVSAVSGVLPGQGQAVTISGVTVGRITSVELRQGVPVVSMHIDPGYAGRIYPNATVLLRPKTGLEDMVAELDPGSAAAGARLHSGATVGSASTLPSVDLDELLAQLDTDTRAELMSLVDNAGQALASGGGRRLGNVLRDFDPLSRDVERATHLLAERGRELRALIGHLAQVATELGDNGSALSAFVEGNARTWHAFAQQDLDLRRTIGLLPGALRATDTAASRGATLAAAMRQAFSQLLPAASTLGPTLRDLRPFLHATTPVFRAQLRPFSVAAQPTARLLAPATRRLAQATPGLDTLARELDNIVDELAHKPPGGESFLFYLPWASHDTDSLLSAQDGIGPVRQGMLLFSCGTLSILQGFLQKPSQNPTLATLLSLLDLPSFDAHCNGTLPR